MRSLRLGTTIILGLVSCTAAEPASPEDARLREAVMKAAHTALEETVDWPGNPASVVAVVIETDPHDGIILRISYRVNRAEAQKRSVLSNAIKLVQLIFTDVGASSIQKLILYPGYHGGIFTRGKDRIGIMILPRRAASQVDWQDMNPDQFEALLATHGRLELSKSTER